MRLDVTEYLVIIAAAALLVGLQAIGKWPQVTFGEIAATLIVYGVVMIALFSWLYPRSKGRGS